MTALNGLDTSPEQQYKILTTCRTANMVPPIHPNAIPTRHKVQL